MKKGMKKLIKRIEASNETFDKMSDAEKRIEVARDCIERIQLNNLRPINGVVFDRDDIGYSGNLKTIINSETVECSVCAKGGLFMSYIGKVNNFKICNLTNDSQWSSTEMQKLSEIFTREQLDGIEVAYEESIYSWTLIKNGEFIEQCGRYRHNIGSPKNDQALISICKNIIKNNGEFVPIDFIHPDADIS